MIKITRESTRSFSEAFPDHAIISDPPANLFRVQGPLYDRWLIVGRKDTVEVVPIGDDLECRLLDLN